MASRVDAKKTGVEVGAGPHAPPRDSRACSEVARRCEGVSSARASNRRSRAAWLELTPGPSLCDPRPAIPPEFGSRGFRSCHPKHEAIARRPPESLSRLSPPTRRNYAAADDAHEAEQADDVAPREARDTSAAALRETVMDLRRALEPGGRAVLTTFGLAAPVSEKPTEILTTGRYVLSRLEDDALPWPKPRRGVSVDRKLFIEDLTAQVAALGTALAKVATETKELESTKLMRDTVESVHHAMFSLSAGLGWEVFKAAGKVELADRIRPSARRPGQTDVPPEEPAPTPPL
jgi:hypothetical protein